MGASILYPLWGSCLGHSGNQATVFVCPNCNTNLFELSCKMLIE